MILDQRDQHNQSLVGAIWTKTVEIVETLFLIGALLIPLHFLAGLAALVCTFGNLYSPPPWLWIELKVLVYPSTLIIWFRLLATLSHYKLRLSQKKHYIYIFIFSLAVLGLALNPLAWYSNFAFPLLSATYTIQFVLDTRLPAKSRRKRNASTVAHPSAITRAKNQLYTPRQEQATLSQQEIAKIFEQTGHHTPTILSQRVAIWHSPSSTDERFAKRLRTHLQPKIRQGDIDLWDASQIQPGALWQDERARAIKSAAVAVVLVSADFMACDSIACNELPQILSRAMINRTIVLSIHVNSCNFEGSGLERFHPINSPKKPLAKLAGPDREKVLAEAAHIICQRLGLC